MHAAAERSTWQHNGCAIREGSRRGQLRYDRLHVLPDLHAVGRARAVPELVAYVERRDLTADHEGCVVCGVGWTAAAPGRHGKLAHCDLERVQLASGCGFCSHGLPHGRQRH